MRSRIMNVYRLTQMTQHQLIQPIAFNVKAGFGFVRTNVQSRGNPVYKVCHQIRFCGNEPIVL
jgi:hypothetical protein